eukprot:m.35601 g.35601  ORF g.35601 m.35601 type:complete len:834 (+) comp32144_c0_seq3:2412-4913(+)
MGVGASARKETSSSLPADVVVKSAAVSEKAPSAEAKDDKSVDGLLESKEKERVSKPNVPSLLLPSLTPKAETSEQKTNVTAAHFSRLNAGPVESTYDLQTAAATAEKAEQTTTETDGRSKDKEDGREKEKEERQEMTAYRNVKGSDVFELFTSNEGEQFVVYFKENGKRYYIDWDKQEWVRFPESWLGKGRFEYFENPVSGLTSSVPATISGQAKIISDAGVVKESEDGRSGVFEHPTKGKIFTYVFEKLRNIPYVFDNETGGWLKMPLSWEKNVSYVKPMIEHIQTAVPQWKDVRSILAALRASNYRVDDCIANYVALQDDGALDDWPEDDSSLRNRVKQLEKDLQRKTFEVKALKDANAKLDSNLSRKEDTIEDLKDRLKEMKNERDDAVQRAVSQASVIQQWQQTSELKKHRPELHVDAGRIVAVHTSVRSVKTILLSLRQTTSKHFSAVGSLIVKAVKGSRQIGGVAKKVQSEVEELRNLYRKECVQRKLLYNQLQELRGNIRVFCRCRPDHSAGDVAPEFPREGEIVAYTSQGVKKGYEFDKVYDPASTQEQIFDDTKPTITSCVDGYNVCILAYGQTGSGKTYTMMGPSDNPGVNIRSVEELLNIAAGRKQIKYTLMVSILEVYNETVLDLLESGLGATKLQIQATGRGVSVPGLTEVEVKTLADVREVMRKGDKNRSTAQTAMNSQSSRSHLILSVSVTGIDAVSKAITRGKLMLVDLAGSERISRSEATGQRLVEAAAINKSLTSLGQVFTALRTNALHIPYRNSKLTHLLQPALGGDSKACMFVNISPAQVNIAETISSLQFGQNARQVELGPAQRHITKTFGK